jgi:hypothetical protein
MGFNELIEKTNTRSIARFANVTVTARLSGAVTAQFLGICNENAEVVAPFQAEATTFKTTLTAASSDMDGVTSGHVLTMEHLADSTWSLNGREFRFEGKPRPDGVGLTTTFLTVKK